jgi:hypothetical protein
MPRLQKPPSTLDDIREICIDFGLPVIILVVCGFLIFTGKDSEVKSIMTLAAGWIFKSGYTKGRK